MRQPQYGKNLSGLSLVELVVVILIVATLAFFLFPVLPHPHSPVRAKMAACMSGLKQLSMAALSYSQDFDDALPPVWIADEGEPGGRKLWYGAGMAGGLLGAYVRPELCPEAPNVSVRTYMYNDLAAGVGLEWVTDIRFSLLMMDGEDLPIGAGHSWTPGVGPADCLPAPNHGCLPGKGATLADAPIRHRGGAVYTSIDGHARWLKPEQVFYPARGSDSRAHRTADGQLLGPNPGAGDKASGTIRHGEKGYAATFHVR